MRPQDDKRTTTPPQRHLVAPQRDAAANVVRQQIHAIYNTQTQEKPEPTHTNTSVSEAKTEENHISPEQWQQYHSAWQNYYQQYYHRYYTGQMRRVLENETTKAKLAAKKATEQQEPETPKVTPEPEKKSPTKEEAMQDLRQKLRQRVTDSAVKVRKSRHFIPVAAALSVVTVFAFLQYNSILFGTVQAYISPGAIDPQNVIVDPTTDVQVSSDPRLIIPKINVDVPMVYGSANDHDSMMAAMQKGVAHFAIPGASSVPGQNGNAVFSGHSSNDLFEPGDYKFIFSQLNNLQIGDVIYANYNGKRYTYSVSKKQIVKPTDVSVLLGTNDKPILTLITCWPIGTAAQRVIITADQISPDPTQAAAVPGNSSQSGNASIPGNGSTVLDKLFGGGGN